jgi:hypothetical protein
VPRDDETCWRFTVTSGMLKKPFSYKTDGPGGQPYNYPYGNLGPGNGVVDRKWLPENDYRIDRERQKTAWFTGIENFVSQDLMATESMGPVYDRTQEHLGQTDKAIIRMRRLLLQAARDLEERGIEPPATHPSPELSRVYSAEKILAPGEDWRTLGTRDDAMTREMEAHPIEEARSKAAPEITAGG